MQLYVKFRCVNKTKITPEIVTELTRMFPPLLAKPEYDENSTEVVETQFEMVTETDLELLDESDSDSEYSDEDSDSDDYSDEDEK